MRGQLIAGERVRRAERWWRKSNNLVNDRHTLILQRKAEQQSLNTEEVSLVSDQDCSSLIALLLRYAA